MRRDQALFLIVGLVLGLMIGLAIMAARSSGGGVTATTGGQPAGSGAPGGAPASDPHETGGVSAQLAALRQRLDKNPDDVGALVELGELFLTANMSERAHEPLHRALTLVGNDPKLLGRLAIGLWRSGTPDEGLEAARRALAADPSSPQAAEIAAQIAIRGLGDPQLGEQALAELKRRAPESATYTALSQELRDQRTIIEDAARKPDDYEAQIAAANKLYDLGRWAESEARYRRALALRGGDPNVLTDLGFVIYQQGRAPEALEQLEEAYRRDPKHWQSAFNGVVVSLQSRDQAAARTWLERLRTANPQHPAIPQFERQLSGS